MVYAEVTSYAMRRIVLKVVTSRYHSGKFFPNEDATRDWNGCPFDHVAPSFLRRRIKVDLKKGVNYYKSGHAESFTYNQGVLQGDVHVSMTNNLYKFTVS